MPPAIVHTSQKRHGATQPAQGLLHVSAWTAQRRVAHPRLPHLVTDASGQNVHGGCSRNRERLVVVPFVLATRGGGGSTASMVHQRAKAQPPTTAPDHLVLVDLVRPVTRATGAAVMHGVYGAQGEGLFRRQSGEPSPTPPISAPALPEPAQSGTVSTCISREREDGAVQAPRQSKEQFL